MGDKENRRAGDGKIWPSIEEIRREGDVRGATLDSHIAYQHERNHSIVNSLSKVEAKIEALSDEMREHYAKEEELSASFLKKGLWSLGALVTALIAYIWQTNAGH
jgi:iron-sulfur cluster repair protein YtfE (RIC family)